MPTKIEWTNEPWNPVTGCFVVSPGCTNCYAMRLAGTRLKHETKRIGLTDIVNGKPVWNGKVRFNRSELDKPLRWRRPRRIFVCPHGDLFHEDVPKDWIDQVMAVAALAPQHTFQVLTKRGNRMYHYFLEDAWGPVRDRVSDRADRYWDFDFNTLVGIDRFMEAHSRLAPRRGGWPLPNMHLGVSVENQEWANKRIPYLLDTPAAIRWVSAEPLLGPVNLREVWARMPSGGESLYDTLGSTRVDLRGDRRTLDWVVVGGESGPKARYMDPDWARSLRNQCAETNVAYFFKQWGEWAPSAHHYHDAELGKFQGALYDYGFPRVVKVGKKRAGRTLDGVVHDAYPTELAAA